MSMNANSICRWVGLIFTLCFLILAALAGCADNKSALTESELNRIALTQKIETAESSGGLVLIVGGDTVTSDEVIKTSEEYNGRTISLAERLKPVAQAADLDQFKRQARARLEDIVVGRISNILLYQHARRQAGDNVDEALDKAAQTEWRKFILGFGGDEAKADEALEEMGLDRNSFKQRQKRFMLTQSYIASKMPRNNPVTYDQLIDSYNEMKDEFFFNPGRLKFRLIDIEPAKLEITDPNVDRLKQARELADGLVEELNSGEDFDKVAEQHADAGIRAFGIQWKEYNPDSLVAPYDMLAREAETTEPGQIAGPIETPGHIFIMKLESKEKQGYEPFEKVQRQVENKVIYDRQNEVLTRIKERLLDQAAISETDEFVDFCLEKIHRMSNQ